MAGGRFMSKVRGIYSTALTKLLLDHGFEIVQPSIEIIERFRLEASDGEPDLNIRDRYDRQGVEAEGNAEAIEALATILREEFFDVVSRKRVEGGCLDFEFPRNAKMKLDEHRRSVTPTINMHHLYKACGGGISIAVDMAENLMQKGRSPDETEELFKQTIMPYLPFEGSEAEVKHVKLSGSPFNLGKAIIESYEETSHIRYSREMRSNGIYDGLEVTKEAGDRAVTEAKIDEYYSETTYYSKEGRFKGAYININTPMELYPSKIRYVDLEIDLCLWPGSPIKVIDQELMERAAHEGVITEKLQELIITVVKRIVEKSEATN